MDIITIGHSTIDTFLKVPDAHLHCKIDTEACELCLNYADKIVVESCETSIGGNAANTGIGLAKLGLKTGIVSSVGDDAAGLRVVETLRSYKVKTDWVKIDKSLPTDQSVILNYQGERTILAYHAEHDYSLPPNLPEAKWIYLTSLNERFLKCHHKLVIHLLGSQMKLGYNPGSHELKAGLKGNRGILKYCEVLILNKEEGYKLMGVKKVVPGNPGEVKKLMRNLRGLGPKVVIVTDALNGVYAFDGKSYFHQEIFPARRIEMTGAGDSFSAGLFTALVLGEQLPPALAWGTAEATSVIQKVGATTGLLNRSELKAMLKENGEIKTRVI